MPLRHPARIAILSAAVWCLLHSPAHAWDLFKKLHHDCDDTQTVRLPAQRVQVETTAPRVTIQETNRISRGFAPVVGTIYMPLALPVGGVGGRDADFTREEDFDPLRTAHLAERVALRQEQARAALRAEVDAKQRVLERMGPPREACPPTATADLDKRLKELTDQITKLSDRVTALEKLTLIHDNVLRDRVQKEPIPAPKGQP